MPPPTLAELVVGDTPAAWERLGFTVADGRCAIGTTCVLLDGAGDGLRSWVLRDVPPGDIDGLATTVATAGVADPAEHVNGASRIDHVVVTTPDLRRTCGALERAGLELRRVREHSDTLHQGFFRLGEVILEVAGPPHPGDEEAARFWGLVAVVPDVDGLAQRLEPGILGAPRAAVQQGRRIVTVRAEAGLSVALAFITP